MLVSHKASQIHTSVIIFLFSFHHNSRPTFRAGDTVFHLPLLTLTDANIVKCIIFPVLVYSSESGVCHRCYMMLHEGVSDLPLLHDKKEVCDLQMLHGRLLHNW